MEAAAGQAEEAALASVLDRPQTQRYAGGFNPESWEQEFDKIPMFMKKSPAEIDPEQNPDLACLQSIIFDEDRSPEEQANTYKNEGNEYFKEKNYKKAVISYTEGLKKKCSDQDLNAVLYTNRAAAQFYLGNYRSALSDVSAARKLKPNHLKAIIRGALCHLELKNFPEAMAWCEEGLRIDSKEKKLVETRAKADRLKRAEQRDARKAKLKEKKEQSQKEVLLTAIKERNIKLFLEASKEEDEISDGLAEMSLNGLSSDSTTGTKVYLDDNGSLNWPVLFMYPEYGQTDFISAFHEDSRFIDHIQVMFAELPPWDSERKYHPSNLEAALMALGALSSPFQKHHSSGTTYQDGHFVDNYQELYFEDEAREEMYQLNAENTLLQVLQHQRYFVKAGTPAFLVLVKRSPFSKNYFFGKKVHRLK